MNRTPKLTRPLGIAFFSCGILADMLLFALLSWAGLEAYFYFDYMPAEKALTTLRCPFVLTSHESGLVTVTYSNPSRLTLAPQVQTEISSPELYRTVNTMPSFAPGETKELQWTITSQDVVFGHLILAEVYVSPVYDTPDREGRCGTLWVDLPMLTGSELFAGVLTASLLFMALGWGLWISGNRPIRGGRPEATRAMLALTSIVLLGTIAGVLGWWLLGLVCLVLTLLLILSTLGYVIQRG
ncbi:MAG: hypothetical protein ABSB41_17850 [Anaerolineales bacterium]